MCLLRAATNSSVTIKFGGLIFMFQILDSLPLAGLGKVSHYSGSQMPQFVMRIKTQDPQTRYFGILSVWRNWENLDFFFWPTHAVSHRIPPWGVHSPCGPVCNKTHLSCSSSSYYNTPRLSILHHPTIKTFDDFISVQRLPYLVRLTWKVLHAFTY